MSPQVQQVRAQTIETAETESTHKCTKSVHQVSAPSQCTQTIESNTGAVSQHFRIRSPHSYFTAANIPTVQTNNQRYQCFNSQYRETNCIWKFYVEQFAKNIEHNVRFQADVRLHRHAARNCLNPKRWLKNCTVKSLNNSGCVSIAQGIVPRPDGEVLTVAALLQVAT